MHLPCRMHHLCVFTLHTPDICPFRLAWVIGFTMGPFPGNERTWKPFNPILGETFELSMDNGLRFIAEQVCHLPQGRLPLACFTFCGAVMHTSCTMQPCYHVAQQTLLLPATYASHTCKHSVCTQHRSGMPTKTLQGQCMKGGQKQAQHCCWCLLTTRHADANPNLPIHCKLQPDVLAQQAVDGMCR